MNITKKRYEKFATGLCWAMLLFYVCVFFLLNFSITPQFYCTEMYKDVVVSVEMWTEKTLFPSNWVFGNQIYYFMLYPLVACFLTLLFSKSHLGMRAVLLGAVVAVFVFCCSNKVAPAAVQVRDKDKDVSYRIYEDLKENDITTMYSVWNYCEKIAVAGNGEIAAGFWDVGNKPFDPKPYLHKTDTYSAPPETTAYIFCSQEEVTAAIEKAARAGTEMTLLLEYPEENIYIYKAPINLMEYYASISSDE